MAEKLRVGFIGLGNMGGPIAANIAKAGYEMIVYDKAGAKERAPAGARVAASAAEVAANADVILLSLPDGKVTHAVADEIIRANSRVVRAVLDTSTIGVAYAKQAHDKMKDAKIGYYDAPVSGGTAGAKAGTISVMFAGPKAEFERYEPILKAMSKNPFFCGEEPGQGQAMKILNNFLSATAMTATSEAIAFGVKQGLDMKLMIDVLNASSGQNTATSDKFPNRIINGKYDAGFLNQLLLKDVSLYLDNAREAGTPDRFGSLVVDVWKKFAAAEPGVDFTRIYPFVRDGKG
jgi:3-hydroxyisobutyrate dehydrogenase-like beta-hydroxyacid dehydrogenase